MYFFLYVFGMVMIIEGLPYLSFPGFMKEVMKKIPEFSDDHLRIYGFIIMITGFLIMLMTHFLEVK